MDLLERYLQAVKFFLPRHQQDDIVRELSENLRAQMEDREEEVGRALTDDERAEILRRHGHPMLVAGRYRAHQYLIGPTFFPVYLFALEAGLGVMVIVAAVLALLGVGLADDPMARFIETLVALPERALMVFAWTTLAFAGLDLCVSRLTLHRTWDPRRLPHVMKFGRRTSRLDTLSRLLLAAAGLVWLLLVPGRPFLVLGDAASVLEFTPVFSALYVPIVLLTVGTVLLTAIDFARPVRTSARSAAHLALRAGTALVFLALLRSGGVVAAKAGATLPNGASLDRIVDIVNGSAAIGLTVALILLLVGIALEIRSLRSRRRAAASSNPAAARTGRS